MKNPDIDQTWIVIICSFITFLIYNTRDAVNYYLGKRGLYKLSFNKMGLNNE